MNKFFRNVFVLTVGIAFTFSAASADDAFTKEIEAARAARVQRLTKPDGWLTLIGLHFLQLGENTIGSAPDNRVIIGKLPEHFGIAMLSADGTVTFKATDSGALVDGKPASGPAILKTSEIDGKAPTLVSSGSVSFFIVERNERKALRIQDSGSDRRTHFLGLDYFPPDPEWRIEAKWVAFDTPKEVPIADVIGGISKEKIPGKAVFEHDGQIVELIPMAESRDAPLFFVISDATSGKETYSAARFLYAKQSGPDGKVVLDFNLAYNPPCAFTPFATCPLPPPQNRMNFAITAGEKKYRGEHE
ncbi:MAG TPA: DUF1684 domain-containing protein [Chthoniobacterales bacterium]